MNCLYLASILLGVCGLLSETGGEVMDDGGRESNTMPKVMNDGGRESNTMPKVVMNDGGRESNTMPVECCGARVTISQKGLEAFVSCRKEPENDVQNDALQECYGQKVGFANNEGFIDNFPIWRDEVTQYFLTQELNEFAGNEAAVCQNFGNQYAKENPKVCCSGGRIHHLTFNQAYHRQNTHHDTPCDVDSHYHPGQINVATRAARDCIVYQVQQSCEEDDPNIRQKCAEERKSPSNWFIMQYGTNP